MHDMWLRFSHILMDRVSGPLKFRLVLQPLMACVYAIIGGLRDAKTGGAPYFWGLITDPTHRIEMLKDGWKSVGKVFILALFMDIAYQLYVQHFVYPGEAVLVAFILAIIPYLVLRGLVTRVARGKQRSARQVSSSNDWR